MRNHTTTIQRKKKVTQAKKDGLPDETEVVEIEVPVLVPQDRNKYKENKPYPKKKKMGGRSGNPESDMGQPEATEA